MILKMKPLSLAEVQHLLKKDDDQKAVHKYVKQFGKLDFESAKKMMEDLEALKNVKLNEEHIIKIVDLLPKDAEDIHKLFNDLSFDEQETNAILEIVKKY